MKLVLLPGMDGTGVLFDSIIAQLPHVETEVVALPPSGSQDYVDLLNVVENQLPNEDYILIAESFSGGIASLFSNQESKHLKGIIFVASFLSSPRPILARLFSYLPIGLLAQLPFSGIAIRLFFMGWSRHESDIKLFRQAIRSVPANVLKDRLRMISRATYDGHKSFIPAACIVASHDRLVPKSKLLEFDRAYPKIAKFYVNGPHFVLQANPIESAKAILKAVETITSWNK